MNLTKLRPLYFNSAKESDPKSDAAIQTADAYLNIGLRDVYEAHPWEYRRRTGSLVLVPNYTVGTATVTQFDGTNEAAAKTVTFSGATLTQGMVGRYFRASGSSYWHKIVSILGNVAYLDVPVVDASGSLTYEIWKRFYYVKSDADVIYDFDKWADSILNYRSETGLSDQVKDISTTGTPSYFTPFGVDPYDDVQYTTGTISVAKNSNVVNGVGTAWLSSGIDSGDVLQISEEFYFVKRVESDTKIILFNYIEEAVVAETTYKSFKRSPLGFQFYNPTDGYRILNYTYLARSMPLVHPDLDLIQLPDRFQEAILSRALYYKFKDIQDARYIDMINIYKQEMLGLKEKSKTVQPRFMIFGPKIPNYMPGRS